MFKVRNVTLTSIVALVASAFTTHSAALSIPGKVALVAAPVVSTGAGLAVAATSVVTLLVAYFLRMSYVYRNRVILATGLNAVVVLAAAVVIAFAACIAGAATVYQWMQPAAAA